MLFQPVAKTLLGFLLDLLFCRFMTIMQIRPCLTKKQHIQIFSETTLSNKTKLCWINADVVPFHRYQSALSSNENEH